MTDINVFRNPFGGQSFGGPGGGGIIASYTFATLPATYAVGQPVWVTDIGGAIIGASPVAATGSLWVFNGAVWAPAAGRVLLAKLNTAITGLTNVEVVSSQILLPAAFLKLKDRLETKVTLTKSGTTDSGGLRVRLGTAGTTADTGIITTTTMAASAQHCGVEVAHRIETATTVQILARNDLGYGGTNTGAQTAAITVANISNALYLTVDAVSGGATNTVGITDVEIWLVR